MPASPGSVLRVRRPRSSTAHRSSGHPARLQRRRLDEHGELPHRLPRHRNPAPARPCGGPSGPSSTTPSSTSSWPSSSPTPTRLPGLARIELGPDPVQLPALRGRRRTVRAQGLRLRAAGPGHRALRAERPVRDARLPRAAGRRRTSTGTATTSTHQGRVLGCTATSRTAPCTCGRRWPPATGATPAVAGYNIMNEPGDPDGDKLKPFYDRAVEPRSGPSTPTTSSSWTATGTPPTSACSTAAELYPNTVYAAHDYALPGFIYGGPYPGVSRGVYVDRDRVEETFLRRTEFMRRTGTPIWIGEFGPVFTGDPEQDERELPAAGRPARHLPASRRRAGRSGPTRTSAGRAWSPPRRTRLGCSGCGASWPRRRGSAWTAGARWTPGSGTS